MSNGAGSVYVDPNTGELVTRGVPGLTADTRQVIKKTPAKPKKPVQPTGIYSADGLMGKNATGARRAGTPILGTERRPGPNGSTLVYQAGKLVGVEQGRPAQAERIISSEVQQYMDENPYGESAGSQGGAGGGGVPRGVQSSANVLARMLQTGAYGQAYQPSVNALQNILAGYEQDLATGAYAAPIAAAEEAMAKQIAAQTGNLDVSNKALLDYLSSVGAVNPYENLKLQQEMVDPQFAQLLQEQGISPEALGAEVAGMQAGQQAQAGQFGNLVSTLAALNQAGLGSRQAEAAMADTFARQVLGNVAASQGGQFQAERAKRQQALMDQISQGALSLGQLQGQIGEARSGIQQSLLEALSKGASINPKQLRKAFASQPSAKAKKPKSGSKNKRD